MLLEKILQSQGFGSRKYCQQLIKNGSVSIDGEVVSDLKKQFSPENLEFSLFGETYQYREKVYLALKNRKVLNVHTNLTIIKVCLAFYRKS